MKYNQKVILKNGKEAWLRNGDASDGNAVYEVFNLTHAETDYLLSYPDENSFDPEQEAKFLDTKTNSLNEIEIVALVDGKIVGTAGIEQVGAKEKVRHRAEFGISVDQKYWGLGVGRALMEAALANLSGYSRACVWVLRGNERAIRFYRRCGFSPDGVEKMLKLGTEVAEMRMVMNR